MPVKLEKDLKKRARKMGLKGDMMGKYVYGTMNKLGLMKGNKKK